MNTNPLLARVANLMSDFGPSWALCGGWAVDAWLGEETREHGDVDLTIFHDDQRAIFEYFGEGWLLNGHDELDDDGTQPWDGRLLGFPSHIHAYSDDGLNLDIQLNRQSGDHWVFAASSEVRKPVKECIRQSLFGLPTLVPEVVLFYKADDDQVRPQDEADFRALAPTVTGAPREWLLNALMTVNPDSELVRWFRQLDTRTAGRDG